MPMQPLFTSYILSDVLRERRNNALSEVEKHDPKIVSRADVDQLTEEFVRAHRMDAPSLVEGTERLAQSETRVPSSSFADPIHGGFDLSRYRDLEWKDGITIALDVQFTGDGFLFQTCPSSFNQHRPSAIVEADFIRLRLATADLNAQAIRRDLDLRLTHIRECLENVRADVERYNAELETSVREAISRRRERLRTHAGIAAQIGYPLRERSDAEATFAVPKVRRKLVPALPRAEGKYSVPEPVLIEAHYEQILDSVYHMAQVLERSPSAFRTMDEEALRTIFLVALNGIYEGNATGETFNYGGKTDILIREADKNIFIAECKFWAGPKSLDRAITQLLHYSVWRDSKLAILLFNRQSQISTVLEKIPQILRDHKNFNRCSTERRPGEYRAVFRHPDDSTRELILTVLTIDVPS